MVLVLCWHHTGSFLVILHDKVFQVLGLTFSKALKQENVMNLCPLVPKLPNKKRKEKENVMNLLHRKYVDIKFLDRCPPSCLSLHCLLTFFFSILFSNQSFFQSSFVF